MSNYNSPELICYDCGEAVPNGEGEIRVVNGVPSWGSVKHREC